MAGAGTAKRHVRKRIVGGGGNITKNSKTIFKLSIIKKRRIVSTLFVFLFAFAALLPVAFAFGNSFMGREEITSRYSAQVTEDNREDASFGNIHFVRFGLIPERVSTQQYRELFFRRPEYLRYFWNSVALVAPILLGQCILAPLAAYGFENLRWKGKEMVFFFYVIIMLLPMQLLLVPNFIVAGWLGIRDSYLAIILPGVFHPLGVFLVRQQLKAFPREVMEAARLDGAGELQIYQRIVRPNLTSVAAALVVLLFADNWNMVDQAVVFIGNPYAMPLSAVLNRVAATDPEVYFAVSCFFLIPAILVFLYGQDYLMEGISLSGVKM